MIYLMIAMMIFPSGAPDRPTGSRSFGQEPATDLGSRIDSIVRVYFPEDKEPGLAIGVSEGTSVLYRKGVGLSDLDAGQAIGVQTRFRMASVSKQFTAMATYRLIEQGKLTFDTRIGNIFEGLAEKPASVTVAQLLTHTSGIWDYEGLIPAGRREQVSDADVLEMIRGQAGTYFEPGSRFRYSNTGFCLLSLIVERISGRPYPDFVHTGIFSPVGIPGAYLYEAGKPMADRAFGYRPVASAAGQATGSAASPTVFRFADQSVTSATKGDGCVYVSADEYHRWAGSLMDGSFPSENYMKDLDRIKQPVRDGIYYSMGWFVATPGVGGEGPRLFHSGETTGFRNIVYLNFSRKLCISIFSNRDDTRIAQVFEAVRELLGEADPMASDSGQATTSPQPLLYWMSETY